VTPGPPTLDQALQAWRRRAWLAVTVFAAVACTAVTVALSLPNLYRATATVIVEGQEVSEAFVRPSVTAELETRLQSIREAVMSRTQLADLIRRLNLYADLRATVPLEHLVARMRGETDLDVKSVESPTGRASTIAFTLTYTGRDPALVARVANELAALYVRHNTALRAGQASKTAAFLKAQVGEARAELDALDRRQNEFRLTHIGELPQQVETNLASIERLNTQLRLNGEDQLRLLDRRDRLQRERLDAATARVVTAPSPEADQLARLNLQLAELQKQFTDKYPDVVRVRSAIETLKRQMPATQDQDAAAAANRDAVARADAALADIASEIEALKTDERELRQSIARYQDRVENVPKRQQELQDLSRDYASVKERYDSLAKRYEEAQLAESLEEGRNAEQFRVLDPAIPPRDPVAPARARLLALGILFAMGLAVASVIAAEKLDTTFHSVEELRAFVPGGAISSLPLIASRAVTVRKQRRAALLACSIAVGLTLLVAGSRHIASGNEQLVRMMERSRG
jgi:polysaccharide chain length determinant protein (PEP-CTERM system associated)